MYCFVPVDIGGLLNEAITIVIATIKIKRMVRKATTVVLFIAESFLVLANRQDGC